jgi:hypothetical protein
MVTTLDLSTADSAKAILDDDSVVNISAYNLAAIATADGMYDLTLQTGISDTVGEVSIVVEDVSLCLPVYKRFYVVEEEVYDALYAASAAGFQAGPTLAVPASTTKPPTNPTLEEAVMYLFWEWVYAKTEQDGTEKRVFADDGTTECYIRATTDSGGIVTVSEAAAGA